MKGLELQQYNKNIIRALLSLKLIEKETPKPQDKEVLIKMYASPVNPSDIAFMQGGYNIVKSLPSIMGFEGAGIVIDTGENAKEFLGKKVSCFVQEDADGTWADFVITKKYNVIPLLDDMDMDQAAALAVNPFTAAGLMEQANCEKGTALILTAAGGQVARFCRDIAKERGVRTINIVRKDETLEKLKAGGVEFVLNEQDDDFPEKLKEISKKVKICSAFDAVGGELTGKIFNILPDGANLILYGGLSNKPVCGLDNLKIIFNKNKIYGFSLPDWIKSKIDTGEFYGISEKIQKKFIEGTFKTEIRKSVKLKDAINGIRDYISNMSKGKILLKP